MRKCGQGKKTRNYNYQHCVYQFGYRGSAVGGLLRVMNAKLSCADGPRASFAAETQSDRSVLS